MKRIGNLYSKIYNLDNLQLADKNARKGKSSQKDIHFHDLNREQNILRLQDLLIYKHFKTSEYSVFTLFDKKKRIIHKLPYFPDRILHHAILQVIQPIFVNCLISQTYSCVKYRGIHKCLRDLNLYLKDRKNTKYCLKLDVKKFYQSIDKDILKKLLRKKFKDGNLLWLLDEIIDSNPEGVPIGNYLSQIFGNFYLTYFDHWLKEDKKVKYYLRYMDDLVILHENKEYLHRLRIDIEEYLKVNLNLTLSNYQVFETNTRGVDFVGYVSRSSYIKLRKTIKEKMKRMTRNYLNNKSVNSYLGWTKWADARNLENKYLKNGRK